MASCIANYSLVLERIMFSLFQLFGHQQYVSDLSKSEINDSINHQFIIAIRKD